MPLAELHGKVPGEIRRLEDALTSSAFGLLTVLPPGVLVAWLRRAERHDGEQLEVDDARRVDAAFWPQFQDAADSGCEPDALLSVVSDDGRTLGALVEVKYRSDMSGWPSADEDPMVRSQLGREWFVLHETTPTEFPGTPTELYRRVLIYVTAEARVPSHTLRAVARELDAKTRQSVKFLDGTYWLSWFVLAEVVRHELATTNIHHERVALTRILDLLRSRKLLAFEGLPPPSAIRLIAWSYAHGLASSLHAPAERMSVPWNYEAGK